MKDQTAYLEFVLEKLRERIQKISLSLAEGEKEIEGMHEYYWENYTEMDQYGYENFDNQQALLNQINTNQQQLKMKHRFKNMLDSPYFGRVDFQYEGEDEPETFYIGIGNFAEETGRTPLIYDWRAPVSGLFYDFDKGEASYQAPGGLMEGEITSKWQYKIRKGKMVYGFESDMKIDDDILKAELGANGDVQLKNIIRTIQKEQNAIIRNTKDRILVIQGVAGSGKTSVALHRIAYLLYHDRKNLKSSNILILSPNGVFSDYISHILPELGEENIQEMSFDLFAYQELRDTAADCEDKYDMIEQAMKDPIVGERCRKKQSGEFLDQMEEFLLMLEDELMNFTNVEYRHYQIPSSRIIELFYEKFLDVPLLSRMEAVMEYLLDEYETLTGRDLSEEERPVFQEKFLKMYETRDLYRIYSRFLEYAGYAPLPQSSWEQRLLAYEDVYPMLYMKYKLLRPGNRRNIKHLVIDEMQDYSRMQYLILAKLFPCKMTILGDKAQTMDEKMQDVTRFLPKVLGKDIRIIQMNKSYRNTVEIAEYAGKLAGMTDMELFERHGKPVEEKRIANREEALEKILQNLKLGEEEYETAAVLTMTQKEAGMVYRQLKEKLGEECSVSYVDRDSSSFQKGITVTTFYLAKGLEFDQVFTLHPGEESGMITQAKYICATRALHELYMYEVEELF
ncbi:MAG: AAA family ATPase [Bacillota bacterium]|nr:AAA family ATPase [Bacillota bacterium]